MKRVFLFFLIIILALAMLVACDTQTGNDGLGRMPSVITMYLDVNSTVTEGDIEVCLTNATSYRLNNYTLKVYLTVKNNAINHFESSIKDLKLIRESNGAEYQANCFYGDNIISLDCDMSKSIEIEAAIPTLIVDEKYVLYFTLDTGMYQIHLYEAPDSIRKNVTINYTIGDTVVKTSNCLEYKTADGYVWESSDHQMYCDEWYKDVECKNKLESKAKIVEDITVYGKIKTVLDMLWDKTQVFVRDINYVPSDGIIVVPSYYGNAPVKYLSNFALFDEIEVKIIYLPITLKKFYYANFTKLPKLTAIYYEGSKEDWDAIEKNIEGSLPVHFNCKQPY